MWQVLVIANNKGADQTAQVGLHLVFAQNKFRFSHVEANSVNSTTKHPIKYSVCAYKRAIWSVKYMGESSKFPKS